MKKIRSGFIITRNWLEKNKVFFETVLMLFASIIGIFVTIFANSIMDKQTRIEEALSKPIINIEPILDDENSSIEKVNIYNLGSAFDDMDIEIFPYYFICLFKKMKDYGLKTESILLPIDCIINPVFETKKLNTKSGLICSINSNDLTNYYVQDMKDFKEDGLTVISSDLNLNFLSLEYFIRIRYTDIWGNDIVEVYQCIPNKKQMYTGMYVIRNYSISELSVDSKMYEMYTTIFNRTEFDDEIDKEDFISYIRYGESTEEKFTFLANTISYAYNSGKYTL